MIHPTTTFPIPHRQSIPIRRPGNLPWAAALLVIVAGCATSPPVATTETGVPLYQQLQILYELDQIPGSLAVESSDETNAVNSPGSPGENRGSNSEDNESWSAAHLLIEYPPPGGDPGFARATLWLYRDESAIQPADESLIRRLGSQVVRVASRPFRSSDETLLSVSDANRWADEVHRFDFPRHQLDLLLVDLADSGFFDSQQRPHGRARLVVKIDDQQSEKRWSPDPRLNDFLTRTYQEAQPGSRRTDLAQFTSRHVAPAP